MFRLWFDVVLLFIFNFLFSWSFYIYLIEIFSFVVTTAFKVQFLILIEENWFFYLSEGNGLTRRRFLNILFPYFCLIKRSTIQRNIVNEIFRNLLPVFIDFIYKKFLKIWILEERSWSKKKIELLKPLFLNFSNWFPIFITRRLT